MHLELKKDRSGTGDKNVEVISIWTEVIAICLMG